MRAIISVSNKSGVIDFARGLSKLTVDIFSTGGTKKALQDAEVPVHSVSELTGFPEILDGRVKTLHPAVHGGILAKRSLPQHLSQLAENQIHTIDLVAVNLYPFVETIAKPGVTVDEALENIDIGGPTMIRAAAKNFPHVLVVVDPADYEMVLQILGKGEVDLEARRKLALKAFQHVASYDTAIAQYLRKDEPGFPDEMTIALRKRYNLRYGENPHQQAAFYEEAAVGSIEAGSITAAKQLWGKELSYNNIMDADATWNAAIDFSTTTVVIVKHTNPCGLATHEDLTEAYRRALAGDPVSAFGGIVAINRPLNLAVAKEIEKTFFEIIIAPGYDTEALALLQSKKDLRILQTDLPSQDKVQGVDYRRVRGGLLVQTVDWLPEDSLQLRPVTQRKPTEAEMKDLLFGWRVVKHVKSNAIVIVKDEALLGMGAGQPNRVTSVHLSLGRAEDRAKGSVLASDAFFPFPDGVELAASGGVTAIIQPGGSVRDNEVIEAANKHNMAMVFTGVRHFKH